MAPPSEVTVGVLLLMRTETTFRRKDEELMEQDVRLLRPRAPPYLPS